MQEPAPTWRRMVCGMSPATVIVSLLAAAALIVACCVISPTVRHILGGVWEALESLDALVFVLVILAVLGALVGIVSWDPARDLWRFLLGE
jgi:hypothetical protein